MDVLMQAETSSRPNLFILIVNPLPLWFVMQFCLSSNFFCSYCLQRLLTLAPCSGLRPQVSIGC